jgi:hypothetical protein
MKYAMKNMFMKIMGETSLLLCCCVLLFLVFLEFGVVGDHVRFHLDVVIHAWKAVGVDDGLAQPVVVDDRRGVAEVAVPLPGGGPDDCGGDRVHCCEDGVVECPPSGPLLFIVAGNWNDLCLPLLPLRGCLLVERLVPAAVFPLRVRRHVRPGGELYRGRPQPWRYHYLGHEPLLSRGRIPIGQQVEGARRLNLGWRACSSIAVGLLLLAQPLVGLRWWRGRWYLGNWLWLG